MSPERWLEFHDSKLTAIHGGSGVLQVHLDAYIHQWEGEGATRLGTGWMQPLQLEIRSATEPTRVAVPIDLWAGRVIAAGLPEDHEGTLTVPIVIEGEVALELETISGEKLHIRGSGLEVTTLGEPRFVENLRSEMDPGLP